MLVVNSRAGIQQVSNNETVRGTAGRHTELAGGSKRGSEWSSTWCPIYFDSYSVCKSPWQSFVIEICS